MLDFLSAFQMVRSNRGKADTIAAIRIPLHPNIWVGKDDHDMPVIIVDATPGSPIPPPLVLRNLRFDPRIECRIDERPSRKRRNLVAAVLRVTTEEPALHVYFLRAVSAMFDELGHNATLSELALAIERLAEIFRSLALPPTTSLQGLWAELLLVRHATDVNYAVRSWHPTRRSLFDFDSGTEAVEVKSSTTGIRKHHFKLAQLCSPGAKAIYVFSLLLTPNGRGKSIPDLWRAIQLRLAGRPELLSRTAEVIASLAGTDWKHAEDVRFEEESALRSLAVYEASAIPRVTDPANPDITDIEFTCDISSAAALAIQGNLPAGTVLTSLLPG